MITDITKTPKKVSLSCIQLHKLTREFSADIGDINRDGNVDEADIYELISYLSEQEESFTREQIYNMDINGDKKLTWNDLHFMIGELGLTLEDYT